MLPDRRPATPDVARPVTLRPTTPDVPRPVTVRPAAPDVPRIDEGERGGALVEFIVLTVALLIPVIYMVLSLSMVQASVFAAEAASREAARVLAADPQDLDTARAQAELAFGDHGLPSPESMTMGCVPAGCHGASVQVSVTVSTTVPIPLVPGWMGQRGFIPVSSTSEALLEGMRLDG